MCVQATFIEKCSTYTALRSSTDRLVNIYLVIQHEQHGATYTHIARSLHLETVCLLSGGSPVPLKSNEYLFLLFICLK